jgi:hypothetical protein
VKVKKRTVYRGRVRPRTGLWHLAIWSQDDIQPICHIGERKWVFWMKLDQGTEIERIAYCYHCLDAAEKLGLTTKK